MSKHKTPTLDHQLACVERIRKLVSSQEISEIGMIITDTKLIDTVA